MRPKPFPVTRYPCEARSSKQSVAYAGQAVGDGRHCRLDADLRTLRQITPHQADLENLIVRRGKCVSDSSAGRSLSPSLPCFRAQRPAKPTFRNPGVRTEQETNRGRQFALTVLITNAWKIRRAAAAWGTRGSNRSRRFQVRRSSCYRSRCTTHTIKSVPLNRGCEGALRVTCEQNRPSPIPVSIRLRRRP